MSDQDPRLAGRRLAVGGCALFGGGLSGLAAFRYGGALAFDPPHLPAPSPAIAVGAVGLVCYAMFFLCCEAALLVLAVINIQDEKVHNKYRSLMLLVLYIFTFRYRRVLPARYFAEGGNEDSGHPVAAGRHKAGKHRLNGRAITMNPEPPAPVPPGLSTVTDEEIRAVFTLLLARMASLPGDREAAAGHTAAADVRKRA